MEIILKEDVENLGHRGDVVKVAQGYGRNFLLPKNLAIEATAGNKAVIEQMKNSSVRRFAKEKADAELLLQQVEQVELSFTRKTGDSDHLFGSVTGGDIVQGASGRTAEIAGRISCAGSPASRGHRACKGDGFERSRHGVIRSIGTLWVPHISPLRCGVLGFLKRCAYLFVIGPRAGAIPASPAGRRVECASAPDAHRTERGRM